MAGHFPSAFLDELRAALSVLDVVGRRHKLRKAGSEYKAIDDESLSVNPAKNIWFDFGKGKTGGDIFEFEMFSTGCTFAEAVANLAQVAGLPLPRGHSPAAARPARKAAPPDDDGPLGPEPPPPDHPGATRGDHPNAPGAGGRAQRREITATYDYTDADGQLLYQVCRQEWIGDDGRRKKTFNQRRPHGPIAADPAKQCWIWGLGAGVFLRSKSDGNFYSATKDRLERWRGAERIQVDDAVPHGLYRYPELREEMLLEDPRDRRTIWVAEGEKDVETLRAWGCVATTNSGGAGNWRGEHAEELRGADVVMLLDNDQAGRKRGHAIALSLRKIAASVRTLSWPDHWRACPDGGDVTDWRDKGGGTVEQLYAIVDKLPEWSPEMPSSAFGAVRFADIDKYSAQLQWTIKGILQKATVSLWYGAPSSGKSFLLTDAAMSVARGSPWMGHRTRLPGLVIYQTGEGGVGFRLRLKAYREHAKLAPGDDIPFIYLPMRINLFLADADVDKMIEEIKAWASFYDHPLELVVIDTFNAASGGANENANQDVGKVLDRCRKIVDATGAHVAVVHHTPAAGGRPRGHSSLVGDVETTIAVETTEQTDDETMTDGHVVRRTIRNWTLTKQKDGPSQITKSFVLRQVKLGEDEDGDALTSCVVSPLHSAVVAEQRVVPEGYIQLHAANLDVFRGLVRALAKKGRTPPPEAKAPPGVEAITVREWNDDLIAMRVGHEDITPTVHNRIKNQVWNASKKWIERGLIEKGDVWVWRTPKRVHLIDKPPYKPVVPVAPKPILAPGEAEDDIPFELT